VRSLGLLREVLWAWVLFWRPRPSVWRVDVISLGRRGEISMGRFAVLASRPRTS
jgi:hypothetical protein